MTPHIKSTKWGSPDVITSDLEKRIRMHNAGRGAKYTRSCRPVELVYYEEFDDKIEAQRREYAIKQLTRSKKLGMRWLL